MHTLNSRLLAASERSIDFFIKHLKEDGSLRLDTNDLCSYYKLPMMLVSAQNYKAANTVLTYIKLHFMTPEGDFLTTNNAKSIKPEYAEFWCYTNGWVVRAAQACQRHDITTPALNYIKKYQLSEHQGFITHSFDKNYSDTTTDVLMAAHVGLIHLEGKRLDMAINLGDYLCFAFNKQPSIDSKLYLRMDQDNVITKYSDEISPFMVVEKSEPNQLYFMVGYPIAYLTLLYEESREKKYLHFAKQYADFALGCNQDLTNSNFSHKLAWSLSILYRNIHDDRYLKAIEAISNHFLRIQGQEGIWYFEDDINTAIDQSAEITGWLIETNKNLAHIDNIAG